MLILLEILTMLYHLILYEYPSGKLILEHTFKEIIKDETYETFSSFLAALNQFAKGLLDKQDKLDLVRFGNLIIKMDHLKDVSLDLALVFDANHQKIIKKIGPKIIKKILEYSSLFTEWNGVSMDDFSLLKEALLNMVRKFIFKTEMEVT
ncbi:MAG: hypothetical protein EU532_01715 [Promethearchaeota archaeon]|nr:MAG: hypothetical protein EU532_01715 [Candidatus Lokiarchaeota archaeon]